MDVPQERIVRLALRLDEIADAIRETTVALERVPRRIEVLRDGLEARFAPFADRLNAAQEVAALAQDALIKEAQRVNDVIAGIDDAIEAALVLAQQSLPTGIASDAVAALTTLADDTHDAITAAIEGASATLNKEAAELNQQIVAVDRDIEEMSERLATLIGAHLDTLREAFREAYVAPVKAATDAMAEDLRKAATELILEPLEREAEALAERISGTLSGLLDRLAVELRAFLELLRQKLISGDEDAMARRAEIGEALDVLRDAIPPLESAFQAFSALAGTVGLSF